MDGHSATQAAPSWTFDRPSGPSIDACLSRTALLLGRLFAEISALTRQRNHGVEQQFAGQVTADRGFRRDVRRGELQIVSPSLWPLQ